MGGLPIWVSTMGPTCDKWVGSAAGGLRARGCRLCAGGALLLMGRSLLSACGRRAPQCRLFDAVCDAVGWRHFIEYAFNRCMYLLGDLRVRQVVRGCV